MADAFIIRGDDGEEYGPVKLDEMRDWVRENRAGLGTAVRMDEEDSLWQPWQYYPELVALLAEKQASSGPGAGVVLAPMPRRMVALLADLFLISLLLSPICLLIYVGFLPDVLIQMAVAFNQGQYTASPPLPVFYEGIFDLIVYGMIILYMGGFHAAHGRTPAKSLLKLQVVDQQGGKPGLAKALLRGLVLSFSLCCFGLPLLYAFIDPQRRALHDWVAGTYVVEL